MAKAKPFFRSGTISLGEEILASQAAFLVLGFFIAGAVPFTRTFPYLIRLFIVLLLYGTLAGIAMRILFRAVGRLALSIAAASCLFLLTIYTTSVVSLLIFEYRPVQAVFLVICILGSIFAGFCLHAIGRAREEPEPLLLTIAGCAGLFLIGALYWADTGFYVGIYPGVHLFLKILAYLLIELFALVVLGAIRIRRYPRGRVLLYGWLALASVAVFSSVLLRDKPAPSLEAVGGPASSLITAGDGMGAPSPARAAEPRKAFILLVDALRADHVSCYGYGRKTTPNIDAVAKDATVFRYCCAGGSNTPQSLSAMFTSRPYHRLAASRQLDPKDPDNYVLGVPTLAKVLNQNGFYTLAIGGLKGCGEGDFEEHIGHSDFERLDELKKRSSKLDRAFVFIHYFELHGACDPKYRHRLWEQPEYKKRRADEKVLGPGIPDTYDAILTITDELIGELLEYLKRESLYDDSIIIITADHGAGLGEHRFFGHCRSCYNGELLVPLIIKAPGCRKLMVYETVGLIDMMPTILDLVRIDKPPDIEGRSLAPFLFEEDYREEPERVYYFGMFPEIIKGDYKLMRPNQLYRFKADPLEQRNLFGDLPSIVDDLKREKEKTLRTVGGEPT